MKNKIKKIIPLLLLATIFSTSCTAEETSEEVVEETYTAVRTTEVSPTTIEKIVTYNGKFEPIEQVSVIAKLTGTVEKSYKDIGDKVKAGDSLYTIDSSDINIAIDQAQAQADAAAIAVDSAQNAKNNITGAQFEQSLLSLESSIDNIKTQISTAQEASELARESYELAETTYENNKVLYEAGAVSKSTLDQAEMSYQQAKNGYDQSLTSITTLESQLAQTEQSYELTKNSLVSESQATADIGIKQAQASADTAALAVDSASKNLNDVTPTSPISGVVAAKGVTDDQMVSAGTVAYTIANMDDVVATINVTENVINKLSVGQVVNVNISALGESLEGKITEINPIASQTSTYPVKIKISNDDHLIKPGMFCDVEIVTEKAENTISLPREAVLRNIEKFYVYVVNVDSTVEMREVTTGIDNGEEIEILSGIDAGEHVIIEGQTYVSDSEKVNVIE